MNDNNSSDSSNIPNSLAITFTSLSFLIFLIWQAYFSYSTGQNLRQVSQQRQSVVGHSQKIQGNLQQIVEDLMVLAETDPEAKAIVDKYQIRRSQPNNNQ